MARVSDLIDTTEMYLRTIYELVEEDIVPLRARIAERLHQSGPTVSQTVARMERDGLLTVEGDRHLELTDEGQLLATRVMRKHRLAERLLTDVIGLDWELVHAEACRWEHVMSETVERRLLDVLVIAVCAVPGEAESFEDVALHGRCKRRRLEGFLAPPSGIPSYDTFRRVLMLADPDARDIENITLSYTFYPVDSAKSAG